MVYEILIAWNIIVFLIYGLDKYNSIKRRWRVSEKNLLSMAFCMGGIGALFGMLIFRHKTHHRRFKLLVPLAAVLNIIVIYFLRILEL